MGNDYSTHSVGRNSYSRPTSARPTTPNNTVNTHREHVPSHATMSGSRSPRPSYAATPASADAPPAYDDLFAGSPPGSAPKSPRAKPYPTPPPSAGHYSGASASPRASWHQTEATPPTNHNRGYAPPPSYPPPVNVQQQEEEEELRTWFAAIDESKLDTVGSSDQSTADCASDGHISAEELRQALLNDNFTPFHTDTVKMMLKMFDKDYNSQIEFTEFVGLKKYIQEWKKTFDQHDSDHSGTIDVNEIAHALTTMGYTFSHNFCTVLCQRFSSKSAGRMDLDAFIYACAMINAIAKEYNKKFRTVFLEEYILKKL